MRKVKVGYLVVHEVTKYSTLHGIKSLLDHKYRTFIDKFMFRRATQLYYNENP